MKSQRIFFFHGKKIATAIFDLSGFFWGPWFFSQKPSLSQEGYLRRVLIYGFLPPRITEKMGKNGLAHMVPKGTGTDPKPFYMNFYDSLGTF